MTENAAELSFQEAFDEAQSEEAVAAAKSESPASEEADLENESETKQSAVETEEEVGLFSDFASEAESEQSEEDSHEVTVNGEVFKVSLGELVNGYQRQADYTQGTQEVAENKKQHANAITLWEALEADYAGTVQKLMARSGVQGQIAQAPEQDIGAIVAEQVKQGLASDPRLQELENENSRRQIEDVFKGVETEYNLEPLSNQDKQVILEKAQEWETTDLGYVVFRLLQQKEKTASAQKNAELVSSNSGRRSGTVEDVTTEAKVYSTVKEAWEASIAEEGNL